MENNNYYVYASDSENKKTSNLTLDEAINQFRECYTNSHNHYLSLGVETSKSGVDLLACANNTLALLTDNQNLINNNPELLELQRKSKLKVGQFADKLNRAKLNYKTLTDMFKESDRDCYDTCDTIFDTTITCDEIDEAIDEYDRFHQFINDNVYVHRLPDKIHSHIVCDYTEFIFRYYDQFKKVADECWRYTPDDEDDFAYDWCAEFHKLLAGYGSDSTYEYLNEVLSENTFSDKYRTYLNENLIPYISFADKQLLLDSKSDELSFKDKCIKEILESKTTEKSLSIEDFRKWIKEYQSDNENWKRDEKFDVNGHTIKTKSNCENHIIIDNMMIDLSPKGTYIIGNKNVLDLTTDDYLISR